MIQTQAEEAVARYVAEAREQGREVSAEAQTAMVAAEVSRLQYRSDHPISPSTLSESAPSTKALPTVGAFIPLRRILGREVSPEEYAAAQTAPDPRRPDCAECNDSHLRSVPRAETDPWRIYGPASNPTDREAGMVLVNCAACPPDGQRWRNLRGSMDHADHARSRFSAYQPTTAKQRGALLATQDWAEARESRPFLILVGPVGTGKSHLAKAAALYRAEHGARTYWQTADGLLRAIRATFDALKEARDGSEPSRRMAYSEWAEAPVLAIDDIGRGYATDWAAAEIEALLFERYEAARPTIITSNLELAGLAQFQGDPHGRLISRLSDVSKTVYVVVDGSDHRRGG